MNGFLIRLFLTRTDNAPVQFFRYALVGGLAAAIDMGVFYYAQVSLGMHYIGAQSAGFALGMATNYLLSVTWVFQSTTDRKREIFLFVAIGVGGLLLSYLFLWLLIDGLHLTRYGNMPAKSIAVTAVLAWNFGMRRTFVFRPLRPGHSRKHYD